MMMTGIMSASIQHWLSDQPKTFWKTVRYEHIALLEEEGGPEMVYQYVVALLQQYGHTVTYDA
jgi:hypothetical protein